MEKKSEKKDLKEVKEQEIMDYNEFVFNPYDLNSISENSNYEKQDNNPIDYNPYDLNS